jgi:hypothetical protein
MRLKTKILTAVAVVFIGHFILAAYLSHQQIKAEVITDIRRDAGIVRGMVMAVFSIEWR